MYPRLSNIPRRIMLGGEALSGARAERLRAMEAAAEITGTRAKASGQKADINIPGVGSKGAGGVKMKPQGIMVSYAKHISCAAYASNEEYP